jgi:hypothetical protein
MLKYTKTVSDFRKNLTFNSDGAVKNICSSFKGTGSPDEYTAYTIMSMHRWFKIFRMPARREK